jgi:hypothetical protein
LVFPSYKKLTIWNCQAYRLNWSAPLINVVEGRRECPYCSGEKAVPGKTSLKALYTELAKEYYEVNSISSDHILPSYGEYVLWKKRREQQFLKLLSSFQFFCFNL